jgi:hypothetical protein
MTQGKPDWDRVRAPLSVSSPDDTPQGLPETLPVFPGRSGSRAAGCTCTLPGLIPGKTLFRCNTTAVR